MTNYKNCDPALYRCFSFDRRAFVIRIVLFYTNPTASLAGGYDFAFLCGGSVVEIGTSVRMALEAGPLSATDVGSAWGTRLGPVGLFPLLRFSRTGRGFVHIGIS